MISVVILINGQPIMARSAVNTKQKAPTGATIYNVDDGSQILHQRDLGAVPLAIKLLKRIKESK